MMRVKATILEYSFQRLCIPGDGGVPDDVDGVGMRPGRRQHGVELREQRMTQLLQLDASEGGRISSHHPGTTSICHQREDLIAVGAKTRQSLDSHEQVLQRFNAQHAGAADRRVEHDVRARKCPRV